MDFYDVIEKLGRGTFGIVYICSVKHNKQKLVVKEIPIDLVSDDIKRAKNEATILKTLNHPNVIKYLDSYIKNFSFYIVMEYACHGNLQHYIMKRKADHNYLEAQAVMDFFCQILMGLNHIHDKGIVHRDLKSENIFITGINSNVLKIGDFGISKEMKNGNGDNICANTVIGTCNYMAPEIFDGKPYDNKTDIWALGCILYQLCQLEKMFEGTVSNVVLSIASAKLKCVDTKRYGHQMQKLLDLLMKTDPSQRPDTKSIMSLNDIFPSLYCLYFDLGCIS
ncbi:serine/threonine-protein kinase nekl-2-like [Anthonomus grandis grandis]|uniref:serine/threonine-protein kinase nekl-2-like n=1 Tax=Anthonomus grandis grandis TaxID=2921223 RepID=UPI002165626A|nr:serine/threonine-protein kinase nekl-2-like [Anthonomus grandis grandis]